MVVVVVMVVVRVLVGKRHFLMGDTLVLVVVLMVVVLVVVVTPEALIALELWWDLVWADEGFYSVLRGEVEGFGVHLLVSGRHPVQFF